MFINIENVMLENGMLFNITYHTVNLPSNSFLIIFFILFDTWNVYGLIYFVGRKREVS